MIACRPWREPRRFEDGEVFREEWGSDRPDLRFFLVAFFAIYHHTYSLNETENLADLPLTRYNLLISYYRVPMKPV